MTAQLIFSSSGGARLYFDDFTWKWRNDRDTGLRRWMVENGQVHVSLGFVANLPPDADSGVLDAWFKDGEESQLAYQAYVGRIVVE